ncbi:PilZ domain-containing protein [Desulfatitalea tepidiphila]|uniref:PilZ domain-containing protein n=1 Tax=Desulfatitalea tepidiphila TaxID=1185843 RepID=UPI0006B5D0FF|nr:PilZ domain-containing protein [Desulfatitalea tepidiphila]
MTNEEKRKHSRIDSVNLLNYVYFDENEEEENQGMGRTLNVSESGILLETHSPMDARRTVSLTIGFKEDVVDIKGKVVYMRKMENNMFESGIEFFDIDQSANIVLKKYIEAFNENSQP